MPLTTNPNISSQRPPTRFENYMNQQSSGGGGTLQAIRSNVAGQSRAPTALPTGISQGFKPTMPTTPAAPPAVTDENDPGYLDWKQKQINRNVYDPTNGTGVDVSLQGYNNSRGVVPSSGTAPAAAQPQQPAGYQPQQLNADAKPATAQFQTLLSQLPGSTPQTDGGGFQPIGGAAVQPKPMDYAGGTQKVSQTATGQTPTHGYGQPLRVRHTTEWHYPASPGASPQSSPATSSPSSDSTPSDSTGAMGDDTSGLSAIKTTPVSY